MLRIILLMAVSFAANGAISVYHDDFSSGDWTTRLATNFTQAPQAGAKLIDDSKFGGKALNVYLKRLSAGDYRSELMPKGVNLFDFDTEYWLGLTVVYPENWASDAIPEINPFQVHNRYTDGKGNSGGWGLTCVVDGKTIGNQLGNAVGTAPFLMQIKGPDAVIHTFARWDSSHVAWRGANLLGQKSHFIFHFKISRTPEAGGFVEAWRNGTKLFREDKVLSFIADRCNYPLDKPSLQFGIYKYEWKRSFTPGITERSFNVKYVAIAKGPDGYQMVGGIPEAPKPIVATGSTTQAPQSSTGAGSVVTPVPTTGGMTTGTQVDPPIANVVPKISNVRCSSSQVDIYCTFVTNEYADTRLKMMSPIRKTVTNYTRSLNHRIKIGNLVKNTRYGFFLQAKDAQGDIGSTDRLYMRTKD